MLSVVCSTVQAVAFVKCQTQTDLVEWHRADETVVTLPILHYLYFSNKSRYRTIARIVRILFSAVHAIYYAIILSLMVPVCTLKVSVE